MSVRIQSSAVATAERRIATPDRRRVPRGGRRPYDQPGKHPPVLVADTDEAVRRAFVRYPGHVRIPCRPGGEDRRRSWRRWDGAGRYRDRADFRGGGTELASSPRVPTIVTVTDELHAAPRHAAARLVKPFPLPTLLDEVRRILRGQAATTQAD